MNALTISQPYASLIADGEKWVENRTWPTPYRGLLAIHAGKGTQYLTRTELAEYPNGCVIAIARLVACVSLRDVRAQEISACSQLYFSRVDIRKFLDHPHTEGPWCWVLRDIRKLRDPISCIGKQGLWDWNAENLIIPEMEGLLFA